MKSTKAITLISLIITIVIMLILAGISISFVVGKNGLFNKAKAATEISKKAEAEEMIKNMLAEYQIDKEDINKSKDDFLHDKKSRGDLLEVIKNDDGTYLVKKDIYEFLINSDLTEIISNNEQKVISTGSWDGISTTPKLMDGMTGVYWDEDGKEIEVTPDNQSKWYNYLDKKWANAKTKDGSYWVWIPRFEYKISGSSVDVRFIPTSQVTVNTEDGYTYIHPSFRDGSKTHYMNGEWDEEIPGFWVAKYAAGFQASTINKSDATDIINKDDDIKYSGNNYSSYNTSNTVNAISQDLSTSPKLSYPVFKPLTYAYNLISISDSYLLSKSIASANDFYALNSIKTDSHLMKNSEWGAVAYLTQSQYGRNGQEVTQNTNNLNNYNSKCVYGITGYSLTTPLGVDASTTNNITGVFDTNGLVWQRVAGYITNGQDSLNLYGRNLVSEFSVNTEAYKTLSSKYVTIYPYGGISTIKDENSNNWQTYNGRKSSIYGYGDAILEVSSDGKGATSWNGDYSYYPNNSNTFFARSGFYGTESGYSGTYAFSNNKGDALYHSGFRTVLIGAE